MRKIIAILGVLAFLAAYIGFAATIGSRLTSAHPVLQLIFYVVAGIIWVLPLRPLMAWMNKPSDHTR